MYYRRKILLAILEAFGGNVGKIDLQKLLLIYTRFQAKPAFDFVPHRYGCYSFQSRWDIRALITYGYVSECNNGWTLLKPGNYSTLLTKSDQQHLAYLKRQYGQYSTEALIKETYLQYPYYTIRSEIANQILSAEQLESIANILPEKHNISLYTIGYEGITVETYFNKLIRADVKLLCDVRRNPISQKVGFSKYELVQVCQALGIKYLHIPELGIASHKRKNLHTQQDYNELFKEYSTDYLPTQKKAIRSVFELMIAHQRVALTCFEASYCQCHRGQVAKAITQLEDWDYDLIHL